MNPLRSRAHRLIDRLSDEDLQNVWPALQEIYYDTYLLRAIQEGKQTLKPGDTLNREEALRWLLML